MITMLWTPVVDILMVLGGKKCSGGNVEDVSRQDYLYQGRKSAAVSLTRLESHSITWR